MLGSLLGKAVGDEKTLEALRVIDLRADTFRRLVDRHLDDVYRLAGVILSDRIEAEDAVHDAAVAAWRGFADLRNAVSLLPLRPRPEAQAAGTQARLGGPMGRVVVDHQRSYHPSERPIKGAVVASR